MAMTKPLSEQVTYEGVTVKAELDAINAKLADWVSVKDFGAVGDGATDDTAAIQASLNTRRPVYFPAGDYLITSSLMVYGGSVLSGPGSRKARIFCATDITLIRSDTSLATTAAISNICIKDLMLDRTLGTAAFTTYHIRITNGATCELRNLYIKQIELSTGTSTRTGGIWFERGAGASYPGSVNRLSNIHIHGGGLYMQARDNHIDNLYVWSWSVGKGVYLDGGGNYLTAVEVIPNPTTHGFYLTQNAVNCSLVNCTADGSTNGILTGKGIYANRAYGLRVIGSIFYNCMKEAIHFVDMLDGLIQGCRFNENNRFNNPSDANYDSTTGYSDILIESVAFSSSGNVVTGNVFRTTGTRTTKGYAIEERNGGAAPGPNNLSNNFVVSGQFLSPNILAVNSTTSIANNKGSSAVDTVKTGTATVAVGANNVTITHGLAYNVQEQHVSIFPTVVPTASGIASWSLRRLSETQLQVQTNANVTTTPLTFAYSIRIP